MIPIQCESCGKHMKAPREAAGKAAKCPACGHSVYIPIPPEEADELPLAPEDADELRREEALLEERRRLDRIRRHANPTALVLRICANEAYNTLRRRRRRRTGPLPAGLAGGGPSVEEQTAAQDLREQVLVAVGRLPRKQALAVLMRVVQEQSYDDIAAALGCAEDTARSHVAKGRAHLRKALADYAPRLSKEVG